MNVSEKQPKDPVRSDRPKRRMCVGLAVAALAVVALAEIVLPRVFPGDHEPHYWFERIPGWGSLYGLVSCVAIIVVSKFLGKVWLMRREDHYDS